MGFVNRFFSNVGQFAGNAWNTVKDVGSNIIDITTGRRQKELRAEQINEAQKNRDFQERLSSTAYQRQVKDLAAAGLNPIIAAGGTGASTPGGSVANTSGVQDDSMKLVMTALQIAGSVASRSISSMANASAIMNRPAPIYFLSGK